MIIVMGKQQSKEQVVIAQNGSQVEAHMSQQTMLMMAIAGLLILVVAYFLWRQFRNRVRTWLRKQIAASGTPAPAPPLRQVLASPAAAPAAVQHSVPAAAAPTYA